MQNFGGQTRRCANGKYSGTLKNKNALLFNLVPTLFLPLLAQLNYIWNHYLYCNVMFFFSVILSCFVSRFLCLPSQQMLVDFGVCCSPLHVQAQFHWKHKNNVNLFHMFMCTSHDSVLWKIVGGLVIWNCKIQGLCPWSRFSSVCVCGGGGGRVDGGQMWRCKREQTRRVQGHASLGKFQI